MLQEPSLPQSLSGRCPSTGVSPPLLTPNLWSCSISQPSLHNPIPQESFFFFLRKSFSHENFFPHKKASGLKPTLG